MHNNKLMSPETNAQRRLAIAFKDIEAVLDDAGYDNECRVITKSGNKYHVTMDFDSVNRLWDQYLDDNSDVYYYRGHVDNNILDDE